MKRVRVAVAQHAVSRPTTWDAFEQALTQSVQAAAGRGAELLVFPEYAAMVLAALFDATTQADLSAQLRALQDLRERYRDLHRRLAIDHQVVLLAGSFPLQVEDGRFVNRAWLFTPSGGCGYQDKQIMTRFEREHWGIAPGEPHKVFRTSLGCIGIAICYDSEFPLLVRAQVEAGAEMLLVPSCTDALAGYHRVRVAAQARALESQCPVLLAPLVGDAPWSPAIDVNLGAAGVYGPPDRGFPDDGVIAQGALGDAGWVYADLDPAATREVRRNGQVLNLDHWPEQHAAARVVVESI